MVNQSIQWILCGGTPNVPSGCPTFLLQHSLYKENHVIWSKHKTVKKRSCFKKSRSTRKTVLPACVDTFVNILQSCFSNFFSGILSIRKTMSSAPKMNERVRRLSICCNNPKVNGKCIKYTLHHIFGSVSSRRIHLSFVFHTSNLKGSKNQSFLNLHKIG